MSNIACNGTELSLQDCPYNSSTGDCTHAQDAGVRCHQRKQQFRGYSINIDALIQVINGMRNGIEHRDNGT